MSNYAWVTLATNDSYSLGALVVAHSLRRVSTAHQLAVLITPGVSEAMKEKLQNVFDLVQSVNVLDSQDSANLAVLKRPELGITFTKLHCWTLTQFEKCVFLDADVLILQNCDELFEREELSAAADVGWPDIFNSGVFVFKPSLDTYGKLLQFADSVGSFDGGDQGLLNQFFSDWSSGESSKRLPFLYNTASTATYSYLPAFKHFSKDVKIIHFIGETKPWSQQINTFTKQVQAPSGFSHLQDFLQTWWNLFCDKVHPELSDQMTGIAGALANLTLGTQRTAEQQAYEDQFRRANWESGQIDYLGQDSFNNIWKKIQSTIEAPSQPAAQAAPVVEEASKVEEIPKIVAEAPKVVETPKVVEAEAAPKVVEKPKVEEVQKTAESAPVAEKKKQGSCSVA